ncbi:AMIN-like domain-containing (lipo)protein [Ornithinimicrobium panacihumi]|uniref:AMIN-like domain-containing (lipo)protein n=1 Tax=Ornithinimicrobium panacihumi TaxID=2008449 RepID=UPI003F8ABF71
MKTTRTLTSAALAAVLLVPTSVAALAPATAATGCQVTWGSLARSDPDSRVGDGTVTDLRAGRHECFDRIVVDVAGVPASKIGYAVRYVDAVRAPGSGQVVPLSGGARLQVEVTVPAYDEQGRATYSPRDRSRVVNVTGWDTLRQVALAGSFEGGTAFGVGVRARLPYRVMLLDGPGTGSRVVIDVAHRW